MSFEPEAPEESRVVVLPLAGSVRVTFRGQGPLLLMINGIGGHTDMWGPLARELSRTRRLVLFDAPGAGISPPLPRRVRMSGLSRVVFEMLTALDINQVDVLGYSWGGALAQQLAHDYPEKVRRLVLIATLPGAGGRPPGLRVAAAMLSPDRYRSAAHNKESAATIYGGDYRQVDGKAARELPSSWSAKPPSVRGYGQQLFAISGWSSLRWLHRLKQPTLIVSGDDDPLVPRVNARILARLIRRSELHLIPDGGHLWALDHPVQSAALIERFLSEADPDLGAPARV